MKYLRQREGLDENDTSMDNELNKLSPNEVFTEVCIWNGLMGNYDETIKGWIKSIYKIDLDNMEQENNDENICECSKDGKCNHFLSDSNLECFGADEEKANCMCHLELD